MTPKGARVEVMVHLRWALVLAVSYLVLFTEEGPTAGALAYVAVLLASNLFFTDLWGSGRRESSLELLPLVDGALVVWGLVAFESSQDLIVAYFFCIVVASFGDSEERVAGAAFLVTGVYAIWLLSRPGVAGGASVWLRLPFVFIATVFYAHVMQRIRTERAGRRRAEARARMLDLLLEISRFFSSTVVTREVLDRVAETVRTLLGAERCRIVSSPEDPSAEPLVSEALRCGEPVSGTRAGEGGRPTPIFVMPILHELEALGVILVERSEAAGELGDEEARLCRLVADAAGLALKNAQRSERLLDLQQRHSRMLRVLSHEVRVPLQLMVGQVQFANEQAHQLDDRELRYLIRKVEQTASEFSGHIDDLLRHSLVVADRDRRQVEKIDLPALLAHSLESIRRLAGSSPVEFALDIAPGLEEVYADPEKLRRVLHHVLLSAMKLACGGSIRVSASVVGGADRLRDRLLALSVEDVGAARGGGSADEAGESDTPGFDLAASIRELVEMLDGRIRFELRPGGHAAFRILVPVESDAH